VNPIPHPRHADHLLGQAAAEQALLGAYQAGRLHHGILLHGPRGVGKATLAFRLARFLLAHPEPASPAVRSAADLRVPPDSPVFRQVASGSHPDLLVLEPEGRGEIIPVEGARRLSGFFGSTAGAGGWRVAVIDPAEALNPAAANALLKTLEEPPARALILLVSHAPGRLPVTIRSRTARQALGRLAPEHLAAVAAGLELPPDEQSAALVARLAGGSAARLLALRQGPGIEEHNRLSRIVAGLPRLNPDEVHALLEPLGAREGRAAFRAFADLLLAWLEEAIRLTASGEGPDRESGIHPLPGDLARWIELWEKTGRSVALAETLNLDRKQALLPAFLDMAEAARTKARA